MSKGAERIVSVLVCSGCGFALPADELYPFRCPAARVGDDIDHVLSRVLDASHVPFPIDDGDPHPFIRYRHLLHVWHLARAQQLGDRKYVELIRELDGRLSQVAGRGLSVTPFLEQPALAEYLSCDVAALLVKDETGGVAGSHKARHLFGTWAHLEIVERLGLIRDAHARAPLAIASCGNAALAAATLARAGGRQLRAYLPSCAAPDVMAKLEGLGAELKICPRLEGVAGDPSYLSFQTALARGEVPFSCQGPDNYLALDGGRTLAYEMISTLATGGRRLDRVFLQAGGGGMASSLIQGFKEACDLGIITSPPPRFHAVQTVGNAPLVRAYDRLAARIIRRALGDGHATADRGEAAMLLSIAVAPEVITDELGRAAHERSQFMWPWESVEHSVATGILDDEAYDWRAVVRGMIESGGFPVLVDEKTLREARSAARRLTLTNVSATGAAGLAGALQLARSGAHFMNGETVAVIFTGVEQ
jgi:threonine synthase